FFFQADDGIRDFHVTGVQTCALPILAVAIMRASLSQTYMGVLLPSPRLRGEGGVKRRMRGCASLPEAGSAPHLPAGIYRGRAACLAPSFGPPKTGRRALSSRRLLHLRIRIEAPVEGLALARHLDQKLGRLELCAVLLLQLLRQRNELGHAHAFDVGES